jgi:hypothetical protein
MPVQKIEETPAFHDRRGPIGVHITDDGRVLAKRALDALADRFAFALIFRERYDSGAAGAAGGPILQQGLGAIGGPIVDQYQINSRTLQE